MEKLQVAAGSRRRETRNGSRKYRRTKKKKEEKKRRKKRSCRLKRPQIGPHRLSFPTPSRICRPRTMAAETAFSERRGRARETTKSRLKTCTFFFVHRAHVEGDTACAWRQVRPDNTP